jgi:hypothetical protein
LTRATRFAVLERLAAGTLLAALMALPGCGGDRGASTAALGTVSRLAPPVGAGSGQPRLVAGPGGQAVLSWLEPDGSEHALKYAELHGTEWSAPVTVARGEGWFVNSADLPSVVPIDADAWIAHWLVSAPDSWFAYDIAFATSADGGASWTEPALLNQDRTESEHGFVTFFPWDGAIGALWLDGRNLAELVDPAPAPAPSGAEPAGTSLRYAQLSLDGRIVAAGPVDELACDCCQTDVAITASGPLAVYRDRTADERRDIVARHVAASGWSEPVELGPDNWYIEGCPVNGPAVAARGNDVAVAWFTAAPATASRDAPGGAAAPRVRLAWSSDAGRSFTVPVDVDGEGSFGHVDVVLLDEGSAAVSWWRRGAERGIELGVRTIARDGALGPVQIVAASDDVRPLDVPQMIVAGTRLLFAWTDSEGEGIVEAAYLDP